MSLKPNTIAIAFNDAPFAGLIDGVSGRIRVPSAGQPLPNVGNGCAFSPDGSLLAVVHTNTPFITIYNTADWSKVTNPANLPASTGNGCAFSPDGSLLAVAHATSPFITIYNTSDWSKVSNPASLPSSNGNHCAFSPDGSKLAVAHLIGNCITIYNTSDWSKITLDTFTNIKDATTGNAVAWRDNTTVLLGTLGSPGLVEFDTSTGNITDTFDTPRDINGVATVSKILWAINGTIEESLAADTFVASVHDLQTGQTLNQVEFTGSSFSVPVTSPDPVSVMVFALQGDIWRASESVAVGAKRFPTNPLATPYYYEVTVAGLTGVSEPVWPVTAGGTVVDGTATFTRVERLIQPVCQSPLIPTPV